MKRKCKDSVDGEDNGEDEMADDKDPVEVVDLLHLQMEVGRSPQICTVTKMGCQNQIDLYRWLLRLI